MAELVLASTSHYRRDLLKRLGLPFRCRAPRVREEDWMVGDWGHRELAEQLALAKVRSLVAEEPGATLIGSDQLVSFEGKVFGKPETFERAVEQLETMAGKAHSLITALAVWHDGQAHLHTEVTTMFVRALDRAEIERYVAADHPLDCAGSYKVEERGVTLFDRIETHDYTAIIGLPLIALTSLLRRLGYAIP